MRTWQFGEADLLVSFFTSELGRLKGVAKAARRSKKRFVNCLDLFCLVNLEHEPRRAGELQLIHSGKLIEGFPAIRRDFNSFSLSGYFVELTEALFPREVAAPEMFELLLSALTALHEGKAPQFTRVMFEARAMALGGYAIDLDRCGLCGREYQAEGRAVFDLEKGGIYCLKCKPESRGVSGFSAEAGRLLRVLQSGNLTACSEESCGAAVHAEIRNLMGLHVARRVGRGMKSTTFLE